MNSCRPIFVVPSTWMPIARTNIFHKHKKQKIHEKSTIAKSFLLRIILVSIWLRMVLGHLFVARPKRNKTKMQISKWSIANCCVLFFIFFLTKKPKRMPLALARTKCPFGRPKPSVTSQCAVATHYIRFYVQNAAAIQLKIEYISCHSRMN